MLNKINIKIIILTIMWTLFLSSCDIPFISWLKILIDNPTNEEINIELDSKKYKIPALKDITISIKKWEHNLVIINKDNKNSEDIKNTKKEKIKHFIIKENIPNKTHLLNPTESDYIIWKTYYSIHKEPIPDEFLSKIKINWVKYEWFFEKINWIFIENNWDYDLKTKEPDTIEVEWRRKTIKSKIWRIKDFKEEYFNRYPNEKPE